jgi:hypothetical protein
MPANMKFEYVQLTVKVEGKLTRVEGYIDGEKRDFPIVEQTIMQTLAKLGEEGWELAAGMPNPQNHSEQLLILKRQKAEI